MWPYKTRLALADASDWITACRLGGGASTLKSTLLTIVALWTRVFTFGTLVSRYTEATAVNLLNENDR